MLPDRGHSRRGRKRTVAAFFDLDKTIISRSSTLAFAPSFYRHGLIGRSAVLRSACAQLTFKLTFKLGRAGHRRMERIRGQVGELCRGWPADQVAQIVERHLEETIVPCVYAEARVLLAGHRDAGQDVFIASASGQEPDRALAEIARARRWPVLAFGGRTVNPAAQDM